MRVLLHSNSPAVPTGYGIQTALLAERLQRAGHEVAISVYYGHDSGIGNWNGIPLLPCAGEAYGNDLIAEHAIRWFDGDPLNGWIIPIMDVFGLLPAANAGMFDDFNVAAWTPVDHHPFPKACQDFFAKSGALPIAMAQFGVEELKACGLDPMYAPLSVDTNIFKPVPDAKQVCGLEEDRFVVMMNGMNKGVSPNRKAFPEAFKAFAMFAREHTDVMLYVHSEVHGNHAGGISLFELAMGAGIGEHQIKFVDQYAYRNGFVPPQQLAAIYSAADVLLAPSRGEGFCLPVVEAQACGTPVIVTDFAAQPELVGAGWTVGGEPEWEAALTSWYIKADIAEIVGRLEMSYEQRGSDLLKSKAVTKAREYDSDLVFSKYWEPILGQLGGGEPVPLERRRIPARDAIAVIVPALDRPANVAPLVKSFNASQKGVANLYFVCDANDRDEIDAVNAAGAEVLISTRGSTYAQKANAGYDLTSEPWLFLCGDDVRFHRGWIDAARNLSDRFDVIGTNDHPDGKGNPKVASGAHADHMFIRRAYIDTYGASLDATVAHEGYRHFYTDVEIVELAKARGVFSPCLSSLVEHVHPDLVPGVEVDDTYRQGWSQRGLDETEWLKRRPLVEMQKTGYGKVRAA